MKTTSSAAQARRKVLTFAASTLHRKPKSRKAKHLLGHTEADEKLQQLLESHPGQSFSLEQIAAHSGLSKRTVRHLEDRALMKLAETIGLCWSRDDILACLQLGFSGPSR